VPEFSHQADLALSAICQDPQWGPGVLSEPTVLARLLSDLLPDAPRETGLLVAAAQGGLASILQEYAAQEMHPATAVRLAGAFLAGRTAFTSAACTWVAGQFALALGLATADQLPAVAPPGEYRDMSPVGAQEAMRDMTSGATRSAPGHQAPSVTNDDSRPPGRRRRLLVATCLAVVAAVVVTAGAFEVAYATSRHHSPSVAVPQPRLAQFVAASQQVVHVYRYHLAPGPVPEIVVTTTSQPTASAPFPAQDVLLLAWDHYARRWSVVYNAATDAVTMAASPDADTYFSPEASGFPPEPLLPKGLGVQRLRVAPVFDQSHGGADLMIAADLQLASRIGLSVAIIHYHGHTATVAWAFETEAGPLRLPGGPRESASRSAPNG
jgi:hypothetical protein